MSVARAPSPCIWFPSLALWTYRGRHDPDVILTLPCEIAAEGLGSRDGRKRDR